MNYKNSITGDIISFSDYQKLPYKRQQEFVQVIDTPTHTVNRYKGDFMLYILPDATNYAMIGGLSDSCGGMYDEF